MNVKQHGIPTGVRMTARRCVVLHAAILAVALVLLWISCYQKKAGLVAGFDAERYMLPILVAMTLIWQITFFDTALCHGVSRRSFVCVSIITGAITALATTAFLFAAWFGVVAHAGRWASWALVVDEPFGLGHSRQFLYAWQRVSYAGSSGESTQASQAGNEWSAPLPQGSLFVFLKLFSLMLSFVAIGMLLGAAFSWLLNRSVLGGAVAAVAVLTVLFGWREWASMVHQGGTLSWLAQAMGGRIVSYPETGVELGTYCVWIPLAESLVLFALCAWGVYALTMRREIHPARGHAA